MTTLTCSGLLLLDNLISTCIHSSFEIIQVVSSSGRAGPWPWAGECLPASTLFDRFIDASAPRPLIAIFSFMNSISVPLSISIMITDFGCRFLLMFLHYNVNSFHLFSPLFSSRPSLHTGTSELFHRQFCFSSR